MEKMRRVLLKTVCQYLTMGKKTNFRVKNGMQTCDRVTSFVLCIKTECSLL